MNGTNSFLILGFLMKNDPQCSSVVDRLFSSRYAVLERGLGFCGSQGPAKKTTAPRTNCTSSAPAGGSKITSSKSNSDHRCTMKIRIIRTTKQKFAAKDEAYTYNYTPMIPQKVCIRGQKLMSQVPLMGPMFQEPRRLTSCLFASGWHQSPCRCLGPVFGLDPVFIGKNFRNNKNQLCVGLCW